MKGTPARTPGKDITVTIAITPTSTRDPHREIARVVALHFPHLGRALTAIADASRMSQNGYGTAAVEPFTTNRSLSK